VDIYSGHLSKSEASARMALEPQDCRKKVEMEVTRVVFNGPTKPGYPGLTGASCASLPIGLSEVMMTKYELPQDSQKSPWLSSMRCKVDVGREKSK
jgi:hypothetical protein